MKEIHDLNVEVEIFDEYRMPGEDLRLLIFQLARELLFNVVKHAGINRAKLTMFEQNNQCLICVSDEGRGFDGAKVMKQMGIKGGFGLFSIRERLALFGGRLEIDSQQGAGVRATIIVPNEPTSSA
jgi:signal transduction histidine kinase